MREISVAYAEIKNGSGNLEDCVYLGAVSKTTGRC
jgi:hypothetical protein